MGAGVACWAMSMTNENNQAQWELGDAITIRVAPKDEPEPETEPADEDAAAESDESDET